MIHTPPPSPLPTAAILASIEADPLINEAVENETLIAALAEFGLYLDDLDLEHLNTGELWAVIERPASLRKGEFMEQALKKKPTAEQLEATKKFWKIHGRMVKTAWLAALKMAICPKR